MAKLAGRVYGRGGEALLDIIILLKLICRQCNNNRLLSADTMADMGGTVAVEKAFMKPTRTQRYSWWCQAAAAL
jgi:hypothetical protein